MMILLLLESIRTQSYDNNKFVIHAIIIVMIIIHIIIIFGIEIVENKHLWRETWLNRHS